MRAGALRAVVGGGGDGAGARARALAAGVARCDLAFTFESTAERQVMRRGGGWAKGHFVHVDTVIRPTAIALLDPARSARPLARASVPKPGLRAPVSAGFRQHTRGGWQDARRGIMAGQFPDFSGTNFWQLSCFIQTQLTMRGTSLLEIFTDWSLLLHMQRLCYFARGAGAGASAGAGSGSGSSSDAAQRSSRRGGADAAARADANMRALLRAVRAGSHSELALLRGAIDAVQAAASAAGEGALKSVVSECDASARATYKAAVDNSSFAVRRRASELGAALDAERCAAEEAAARQIQWASVPPGTWQWEDDAGGWQDYDALAQAMLESALRTVSGGDCDLDIAGGTYSVAFQNIARGAAHGAGRGLQRSAQTGKARPIRRQPKSAVASAGGALGSGARPTSRPPLYPAAAPSGASAGAASHRPTRRNRGGRPPPLDRPEAAVLGASPPPLVSTATGASVSTSERAEEAGKVKLLREFTGVSDATRLRGCLVRAEWNVERAAQFVFE